MMAHKDDIYSRPKRTWFATEKEKKLLAKAAKVSLSLILSSVMHFIRVRCFVFILCKFHIFLLPLAIIFLFLIYLY